MSNLLSRWTYYFSGLNLYTRRNAATVNPNYDPQRGQSWGTPASGAAVLQSMKSSSSGSGHRYVGGAFSAGRR